MPDLAARSCVTIYKRLRRHGGKLFRDANTLAVKSVAIDRISITWVAANVGVRVEHRPRRHRCRRNRGALAKPMARGYFVSVQDRGQVPTEVAVMLADGQEVISDIHVLRQQSRVLDKVTPAKLKKTHTGRARVRHHVWSRLEHTGGVLGSKAADTYLDKTIVLDIDFTIVVTHSGKDTLPDIQEDVWVSPDSGLVR